MTAQIITWVLAAAMGVAVVLWAAFSGPTYLDSYFQKANRRPLTRTELALYSAVPQVVVALAGTKDPFLMATVPLVGLFSLIAVVDGRTKKIPNVLTFLTMISLVVGGVVGILIRFFALHETTSIVGIVAGALIWLGPFWLLYMFGGGIGRADVKLAPIIGAWLGLYGAGVAFGGLLTAVIVGGVYAFAVLLIRKVSWSATVPFGPALVVGGLIAWFVTGGAVSPW